VLSIGKLSAGQARYYLEQGEVRVDAVDSIGDGVEEYYAGGAEARGSWIGSGGAALGLSGPVDGDALRRVLAGLDPLEGSPLRGSSSPVRVAGFDLTFSAPKSVSVLFGIGAPELRAAVRQGHDRAALEAVGYLERSAAAVRRGHGGTEVVPAGGLVRRRSGIAPHGRAIRSCTLTYWSPTSVAARTAAGRRSMAGGCTRTRGRRASSTRPSCAPS
jgi:TrwC relaxase